MTIALFLVISAVFLCGIGEGLLIGAILMRYRSRQKKGETK